MTSKTKEDMYIAVHRIDHNKVGDSGDYEYTLPQFETWCNHYIFNNQKFKGGTFIVTYPTLFYASGPVQRKPKISKFKYWDDIANQFAKCIQQDVNTFVQFNGYKGPHEFMLCHEGDVHISIDHAKVKK